MALIRKDRNTIENKRGIYQRCKGALITNLKGAPF